MIYMIATPGPPTVRANAHPSSKLQRSTKSLQKQPVRSLQPLGSLNCLQRFLLFWFFSFDNFCHRSHANAAGPGQPCALQTELFRCGLGARCPRGAGGLLRPGPRPDPPSAPGQGWRSSLGCLPQGCGCPPCPWFSSWSPALLPPAGHCPHLRGPGLSAGLVTLGNCSPELEPDQHKIPTLLLLPPSCCHGIPHLLNWYLTMASASFKEICKAPSFQMPLPFVHDGFLLTHLAG